MQYRKPIPDSDLKVIIEKRYPGMNQTSPEEFEELWSDLEEASKADSLSKAMAYISYMGPQLIFDIQQVQPWKPTPEEATILRAFIGNYVYAALSVMSSEERKGIDISKLVSQVEKVADQLLNRSIEELEAARRKA